MTELLSSPPNEKMGLSASELSEFFAMWEEFNFTDANDNISHVEAQMCPTLFNRSGLLHAMCTLYVFIFIVGLAANALVVWVNLRSERHYHETHLYILNLAVADLCVVATLPVWVSSLAQDGHWPFGQVACKLTHLLFSVNLFASIFFLACMSVDRYVSVVRSGEISHRRGRQIRRLVCAVTWLLALFASVPDTHFLQSVKSLHGHMTLCRPVYPEDNPLQWMVGVQLSFVVLGFVIPFPIIAVSYALLANTLGSPNSPLGGDQDRSVSRKVILTYIVVFIACWAPYHAVLLADALVMLEVLPLGCSAKNSLFVALHLTQCLSLLHCCVNPVVYSFAHRHYRYDLMKAFIFRYSTRTGLTRLMEGSQGTETEYAMVENTPTAGS
ncbi:Atypical chemokine receptor 3 C-X-C chemokine receptor type 7 [Triplophysa tibetana]|uniref:Atypical chemokine receptor 3 C-X-C chemokine receptor type 7 n=1 Tax=Triplophysa tibetana TaxID=1572043 RepID=A0A5A9P3N7_9TELE|nr:Atypical chemokine receptor 3 C-X-C chemokine receptor type 7 [Triplophysa tibetana]